MVKRCIQISALDAYQLGRLHEIEQKTNYLIPNWNIQEIFKLDDLKYSYNVNTDSCSEYCRIIEKQLREKGIDKMVEPSDGWLNYCHALDWAIINNKNEITWENRSKNGKFKGLLQKLIKEPKIDHQILAAGDESDFI